MLESLFVRSLCILEYLLKAPMGENRVLEREDAGKYSPGLAASMFAVLTTELRTSPTGLANPAFAQQPLLTLGPSCNSLCNSASGAVVGPYNNFNCNHGQWC